MIIDNDLVTFGTLFDEVFWVLIFTLSLILISGEAGLVD